MFSVALNGAEDLSAKLASMPAAVKSVLALKATDLAKRLQVHVVQDKLSGQVLQVKTGALRASITASAEVSGDVIRVRIFSSGDVKYAAIQELGGQTAPHEILPDKAKALAFMVGGKQAFAKMVHHPGSRIPARSYLGSALVDMAGQITTELGNAVAAVVSGAIE